MNLDVSTKEGYLLATAMRGPDVQYLKLKYIITGWIRAQCGVTYGNCSVRNRELTKSDVCRAKEEVDQLYADHHARPAMKHWTGHAFSAIRQFPKSVYQDWLSGFTRALHAMLLVPNVVLKARVHDWLDNYPFPNTLTPAFCEEHGITK